MLVDQDLKAGLDVHIHVATCIPQLQHNLNMQQLHWLRKVFD